MVRKSAKFCLKKEHYIGLPPCILQVSECRHCLNDYQKKWIKKNPDKQAIFQKRNYQRLLKKYGREDLNKIYREYEQNRKANGKYDERLLIKEGWLPEQITPALVKVRGLKRKITRLVYVKGHERKKQEREKAKQQLDQQSSMEL